MRIESKDILGLSYYSCGEAFTGSIQKLRYKIVINPQKKYFKLSEEEKKDVKLRVFIWFIDYAFEYVPEKDFIIKDFEYSKKGLEDIVVYINEHLKK